MPDIALMMIVKNESKTLPRLIESVKPIISRWVLIDTGSTDGTQGIIREMLGDLPGELLERPWVSFGHNRTELIKMIPAEAEYAFMLDADHVIHIDDPELNFPDADTLMIEVTETLESLKYRMPYLVRKGPKYFYQGATHEYLTSEDHASRVNYDGIRITHFADGGSKADKHTRDFALLNKEVEDGTATSRTHFYLAQTLSGLGRVEESIEHYKLAIEKTWWDEEKYVAYMRAGRLLTGIGRDMEALEMFLMGIDACTTRSECAYEAAKIMTRRKMHWAAICLLNGFLERDQEGILFVEDWISDWGIQVELGINYWWAGDKKTAEILFKQALAAKNVSAGMIEQLHKNIEMCK